MRCSHASLALAALLIASCGKSENGSGSEADSPDNHRELIEKFQGEQKRFKDLISTVRDEQSFDTAKPELDKIVSDWRGIADSLSKLDPPSEEEQSKFRILIAEGHRETEPTGEDMLSLLSIESRETEVAQWLNDLASAGVSVGSQFTRLYGEIHYGAFTENQLPEIDVKFIEVGGGAKELDFDWVVESSTAESTQAEQAGGRQSPNRQESE